MLTSSKPKKLKRIILASLFLLVPAALFTSYKVGLFSPCSRAYRAVDGEIDSANFCTEDSDCKVLPLGGAYIQFGCYHYINQSADTELLLKKVKDYSQACTRMIDKCGNAPPAKCVSKKCVSK